MNVMKKHYESSVNKLLKDNSSTSNYDGSISNIVKEDKKDIERSYISEGYDYKKEVVGNTPENINQEKTEKEYQSNQYYNKETGERNKEYCPWAYN